MAALRQHRLVGTAPEREFDDIARLAALICGTPIALMSLVDADRQWLKARIGLDVAETPREHAFCSYTILGDDILVVEDATKDERFARNPLVTADPHIRFYMGAPLVDNSGHALGSLCVIDRRPRTLNATQRDGLETLARHMSSLLELRRVSSELAGALDEVKALQGLLPMCCHCKGIRDDAGYWKGLEEYLAEKTGADFSHGICPACFEKHYPEIFAQHRDEIH